MEMKARGILWFATVTTVAEARAAEAAGADAVIAQGMEAGGHRGAFHADQAEDQMVGLIALLPQVFDAVTVPVIAAGGIADARGVAAALILGASAVQIGTGFLRSPEAMTHPAYADRLAQTEAHDTMITSAFTGRPGRSVVKCIRPRIDGGQRSSTGTVSCAARIDSRNAGRCAKGGDADRMQTVGRAGREIGTG